MRGRPSSPVVNHVRSGIIPNPATWGDVCSQVSYIQSGRYYGLPPSGQEEFTTPETGLWCGYLSQGIAHEHLDCQFQLQFSEPDLNINDTRAGLISGQGTDQIGEYTIAGIFCPNSHRLAFRKRYIMGTQSWHNVVNTEENHGQSVEFRGHFVPGGGTNATLHFGIRGMHYMRRRHRSRVIRESGPFHVWFIQGTPVGHNNVSPTQRSFLNNQADDTASQEPRSFLDEHMGWINNALGLTQRRDNVSPVTDTTVSVDGNEDRNENVSMNDSVYDSALSNNTSIQQDTSTEPPHDPLPPGFENFIVTEDNECIICFDRAIDTALVPCGHVCMCYSCARTIFHDTKRCPLCRAELTSLCRYSPSVEDGEQKGGE
eukprot:g2016.t1